MSAEIAFPTEPRAQFPNASRDEQEYIKYLSGVQLSDAADKPKSALSAEVAKARQKITESLATASASGDDSRIAKLEADNKNLQKTVDTLTSRIAELEKKFASLSAGGAAKSAAAAAAPAAPAAKPTDNGDDDDDVDLFGSDDEEANAEAERIKQERLQAYQEKKAKKPALIAKSSIVLDVKPWDDETDMAEMERRVRSITADGLLWGASKLVPVGYGIKKLQIGCVVEDDKVGTDFLEEEITKFEDYVQSVDVAAFQKI